MFALVAALSAQVPLSAPCPRVPAAAALDSAWQAYRRGAVAAAARLFTTADSLCPRAPGAQTGLGFVSLRQSRLADAEQRFARALAADSSDADAGSGLGFARLRRGERASAVLAFRSALRRAPDYRDAADQLLGLGVDSGLPLAPIALPPELRVPARTAGERFEVRTPQGWRPFYVKGINLGAALPGRFPSQFPADDSTYARWLELMAGANANVVRLYTLFPPAFYRALRRWNDAHPEHSLWLVHARGNARGARHSNAVRRGRRPAGRGCTAAPRWHWRRPSARATARTSSRRQETGTENAREEPRPGLSPSHRTDATPAASAPRSALPPCEPAPAAQAEGRSGREAGRSRRQARAVGPRHRDSRGRGATRCGTPGLQTPAHRVAGGQGPGRTRRRRHSSRRQGRERTVAPRPPGDFAAATRSRGPSV